MLPKGCLIRGSRGDADDAFELALFTRLLPEAKPSSLLPSSEIMALLYDVYFLIGGSGTSAFASKIDVHISHVI